MRLLQAILLMSLLLLPAVAEPRFDSPDDTYRTYLQALEAGEADAVEQCYTKSSRVKIRKLGFEPSPEMLRSTHRRLSSLKCRKEVVNDKRAIMWPEDKSVPPIFFRIQDPAEKWRIDYHFMSSFIRLKKKGWSWRNPRILKIWKSRS